MSSQSKPPTRLTDASIQRYRPAGKRREIADAACPGLRLVIQPSGAKGFAMRFRKPDGSHGKLVLGVYDATGKEIEGTPVIGQPLTLAAARELAATVNRDRARGIDVVEDRKAERSRRATAAADQTANAFGAALIEFFIDHKTRKGQRPRRWREDAAQLGLRYAPGADPKTAEPETIKGKLADVWRDKPLAEIDGHDVFAVVDVARKQNSGHGRKLFAALSSFFGWALKRRRVTVNPCAGVFKPPPPPPRERVLTDAEIKTLWKACDQISVPFGAMFRVMLLTGCRLREVSNAARAELDDDGTWLISPSRTKNGQPLSLPLPTSTLDIIDGVPKISTEYVFSTNGRSPVSGFSKAKDHLDEAMTAIAGKAITPWRLHDLRRTLATGMARIGIALPVIEKILNHVSGSFGGIVGIYQRHEFEPEKREALARWAAHVEGLISGKPENVVALPAKRR